MTYSEIIIFRLRPVERQKLEHLARQTNRSMSQILRLLLAQAELANEPDVRLGAMTASGEVEAQEARP